MAIVKDFCASSNFTFSFDWYWIHINIGQEDKERAIELASFLVDFATLPLVTITLMFTAHGGFKNDKQDNYVNNAFSNVNNGILDAKEDIRKNNEDINHIINEDINHIIENLRQSTEDIVSEIKNIAVNKSDEQTSSGVEGNDDINEDKIGSINLDK